MKIKFNDVGRCLVCLKNPCQCQKEVCCVCGKLAEAKCPYCKKPYCLSHFKSVAMTGNCCSSAENIFTVKK